MKALPFFALVLCFVGCSKDELGPSLVGYWIEEMFVQTACYWDKSSYSSRACSSSTYPCTELVITESTISDITERDFVNNSYYVSGTDTTYYDGVYIYTYTINGSAILFTNRHGLTLEYTYTVSESTLILKSTDPMACTYTTTFARKD